MKKSSTIKFRMFAIMIMVLFSMSALVISSFYTIKLIQNHIETAELFEHQTTILHVIQRKINEIVLIPDNPQTVADLRGLLQSFVNNLDTMIARADDKELAELTDSRIRPGWTKIHSEVQAFLKIPRPSTDDVETMINFGKLLANTDRLITLVTELKLEDQKTNDAYVLKRTIILGIFAFILILFTTNTLISISSSISKPLEEITASTEIMAQGNLSIDLSLQRNDEIGVLADSFRGLVGKLRNMIRQTSDVSADVNLAAENMAESSGQVLASVQVQKKAIELTVSAMEEVDNSVSRLQEGSYHLIDAATVTASAATELAASIAQVSVNAGELDLNAVKAVTSIEEIVITGAAIASSVEKLSLFAEETCLSIEKIGSTILKVQNTANLSVDLAEQVSRSSSEQGMAAINDAMGGIENIRHNVSALSDVVNRLGSKSIQIGKIINVIEDIAKQTGLLALNAAILAAQAGQHGRSFSVVASEIRSLSDRTFLSTKEIVEVITSVQNESSSSVKMALAGMGAVEQGITLIEKVRDALESIYSNSLASTEMSHAIHRETTAEVLVINHINESIGTLRGQIEEISRSVQRQNCNTGDMNSLMEQVRKIAGGIAVATREQSKTSLQISAIAESLLSQSDHINNAITLQKQKSGAVLASTDNVKETADQLNQLAQNMEEAADTLREKARSLSASINTFEV